MERDRHEPRLCTEKLYSCAHGYLSIEPEQGWSSLLVALHHTARTVLLGLDGGNQHIQRWRQQREVAQWEMIGYIAPKLTNGATGWPAFLGKQPHNYHLIQQSSLPLTETGAVDVARLSPSKSEKQREPQNELEEQILQIWRQVLGNSQVGVEDNFFDLGGHSLLATQVVARLQRMLQVEVPLRSLFENPTVATLATAIVQKYAEQIDDATLMQIMAEVEQTSDDELLALLLADNLIPEKKGTHE